MTSNAADRSMIRHAMAAPYLSREEETRLGNRWRGSEDQNALNQIVVAHMRLVISMAGKFRNFGLPASDLTQEGYAGLLEAAARFDPDRGFRFSTYASWWIKASMQDYILRNWSIVRGGTSSGQKALFFNLRRLRAKLARGDVQLTAEAAHQEIATALGVGIADVQRMDARLSGGDVPFETPLGPGEGQSLSDVLRSDDPLPDEQAELLIDGERRSEWLRSALKHLNSRELEIIHARRLQDDSETLEALGAKLGISKERVRQIESRALEKLKIALTQGAFGKERRAYL